MLKLVIGGQEFYNEETQEFNVVGELTIELEHSLVSLSKWESKFEKPFLDGKSKTKEEILAYIEAMILTPNYPEDLWSQFSQDNLNAINAYIDSKQSATTFGAMPERRGRGETITSELIYFWMLTFNIPFECESWHLNRLFALIRICNIKNGKQKKMSRTEMAAQYRDLNAKRRAELGTKG